MQQSAVLSSLPSTRRGILVSLKKRGEARAEDLAADLGITASAVRQHITGLVANGFVSHREIRGAPGRPKHLYHLTDAAEALFPQKYEEVTLELLGYVEEHNPDLVEGAFHRTRDMRVRAARHRLHGKSFEQRVAELTRILDEDGYLADWERLDDGTYRIIEHNCPLLGIARAYGQACSAEIDFIREAMPDAEVERVAHILAGAHHCAYVVRPRDVPKMPHADTAQSSPR